ncbi:MAG: nucleotidyltransferase family protein, partial [Acidobacteria bacterium]|nr:nucleotidyltransferase family protein [Acidobacteriota bacterium]
INYFKSAFKAGDLLAVTGRLSYFMNQIQLVHPRIERIEDKEKIKSERVKEQLLYYYFHFLGANEIIRNRIKSLIRKLNENSISPLILKGIELQDNLYPKPELRPTSDLDILILNQENFKNAMSEIIRNNYKMYEYRNKSYPLLFSKDIAFIPADGKGVNIELHQSIRYSKNDKRRKYDEVFYENENLLLYDKGQIKYFGFCNEANYLYLCHHAFVSHRNLQRIIWILDLMLLRKKCEGEKLKEIAEKSQMKEAYDYAEVFLDAIAKKSESGCIFVSNKSHYQQSAFIKLFDEFMNVDGFIKKTLWLLIWFFPNKDFLKKRYGEYSFVSLYFIYYIRLIKGFSKAVFGAVFEK